MKKILITGISGFAGSFLTDALQHSGAEIHGITLSKTSDSTNPILHEGNLLDADAVSKIIDEVWPDVIYHLAALTSPAESFSDPIKTIQENAQIELNVFDAVRKLKLDSKILITSSAEVYGKVDESDLPTNEESPLKPNSPYGVSKITQDFLALQYHITYGLNIIRVRPFNHIGPKQMPLFVVPAFAKQIAEIEKGKKEPVLKVGNLDAKRDFTDVRDIVRAYIGLMEKGVSGEVYNLGSGTSHKIKDILDMLLKMSDKEIKIEEDVSLLRPSDIPETRCDHTKITDAIGWNPEIPLEQSLKDTLDYWRETV